MIADRRAHFRKGLSELYLPQYDALCAELPPEWGPYSAWRSFGEQGLLYINGRTKGSIIVTDADAGESPHNYGCASDWIIFENKKPVWELADYQWDVYFKAVEKVGLRSGASFRKGGLKGDKPHNEIKIIRSWLDVHNVFKNSGMQRAQFFIEENMVKNAS